MSPKSLSDTEYLILHTTAELKAMLDVGMITKSQHKAALVLMKKEAPSCTNMSVTDFADYLCSLCH